VELRLILSGNILPWDNEFNDVFDFFKFKQMKLIPFFQKTGKACMYSAEEIKSTHSNSTSLINGCTQNEKKETVSVLF